MMPPKPANKASAFGFVIISDVAGCILFARNARIQYRVARKSSSGGCGVHWRLFARAWSPFLAEESLRVWTRRDVWSQQDARDARRGVTFTRCQVETGATLSARRSCRVTIAIGSTLGDRWFIIFLFVLTIFKINYPFLSPLTLSFSFYLLCHFYSLTILKLFV